MTMKRARIRENSELQEQTHKGQHVAQDAQSSHEEMIKKNQLVDELQKKLNPKTIERIKENC